MVATFLLFFALQFGLYCLLTMNFRAVAQGRYVWTIVTGTLVAAAQFWVIRKVGNADSVVAWYGFVCGGGAGSVLGIWLTKKVFPKQEKPEQDETHAPVVPASNWDKATTIASWVQTVAVIASLIFIAVQLKQQAAQLEQQINLSKAANAQEFVSLAQPLNLRLSDREMAQVWLKQERAQTDKSTISPEELEKAQFLALLANYLAFYENVYVQHDLGLVHQEVFQLWLRDLEHFVLTEPLDEHWENVKDAYSPGFRNHVDQLLQKKHEMADRSASADVPR